MIDLHVHTWRCRHATGSVTEYVEAAAARSVRILAFTEHLPLAPALASGLEDAQCYAMPAGELPEYVADVRSAREAAGELGVEVLLGIEADLVDGACEHASALIAQYPFDVVLGSVHTIGDWAFDDPDRTDGYAAWRMDELWERYFSDVRRAASAGIADVVAHADLIKKFRRVPDGPLDGYYRESARAFARVGVAVEVNTAGLRKPCAELYPAQPFLRELARASVPVTIGSDAHAPADVGAGRTEAVSALREAGYRSVLVFRGRVPEEVGIDEL